MSQKLSQKVDASKEMQSKQISMHQRDGTFDFVGSQSTFLNTPIPYELPESKKMKSIGQGINDMMSII